MFSPCFKLPNFLEARSISNFIHEKRFTAIPLVRTAMNSKHFQHFPYDFIQLYQVFKLLSRRSIFCIFCIFAYFHDIFHALQGLAIPLVGGLGLLGNIAACVVLRRALMLFMLTYASVL